jgi:hypothetical protein
MICSTHLEHVSKVVLSSHLCVLFWGSWTVCLTGWITGARHMVLEMSLLIASTENEMVPITVAAWRSPGYKYLIRSPLRTISYSFSLSLSCLGFPSLILHFPTMEGKRCLKQECSPSTLGSPVASDSKTPPLAPSKTPPPPGFPVEVSSCRPRSSVFELGGPSGKALVVDLSSPSDGKEHIHDIAHDFKFTQHLFGELNRDLLGPLGDGKVIVLSDPNEEKEEAYEEKSVGAKDAATSAIVNPVSTASTDDIVTLAEKSSTPAASPADVDIDPGVEPNDSSDGLAPGPKVEEGNGGGDKTNAL